MPIRTNKKGWRWKPSKEQRDKAQKTWRVKNPEAYALARVKNRAKREGLEFDLDLTDIVIPEYCPVLKCKLEINTKDKKDTSISIDRIDSNKGYIKGNIQIISMLANRMKNNATKDQLSLFADWIISCR